MYYNKIAVTTTSPGFYEKRADLGSMQPRESSEIGQQVWIGTQSFSESFKHCKIVLMKVLKMMKRMKKKTLNLNPNSFFGWMFVELALQSCACSLCATLHLTKEADIASAWNLPVESAADPTAMKLQQKRPLQLTDVCVCQANTVYIQHVNVGDTCDMMSVLSLRKRGHGRSTRENCGLGRWWQWCWCTGSVDKPSQQQTLTHFGFVDLAHQDAPANSALEEVWLHALGWCCSDPNIPC